MGVLAVLWESLPWSSAGPVLIVLLSSSSTPAVVGVAAVAAPGRPRSTPVGGPLEWGGLGLRSPSE